MTNILSIEDINYLAQQSTSQINLILSSMTTLMQDTDVKIEQIESQKWYQRMIKTVFGKNKATKEEIRRNYEKLSSYMAEAIAELYNRQCIDQKIMLSLAANLNAVYAEQIQLKQTLGLFIATLNEKVESIDNFHLLNTEIEQGVYSSIEPIVSICIILSQMDTRCLQEDRKVNIIRRTMIDQNILNTESISLNDCLLSITNISSKDAGQVYLELSSIRNNFFADIILKLMEQYYFLPDMARKAKNKFALVQNIIEIEQLDSSMSLSIAELFDDFINSKLDSLEEFISISTEETAGQYNSKLEEAEKLFINYKLDEAFEVFEELAESGNARAMYFLGEYYSYGYGNVIANSIEAEKWRKASVKSGDVLATLAVVQAMDEDPIDEEQLFYKIYYQLLDLAQNEDIFAQYELAYLCIDNDIDDQCEKTGKSYLIKSAEQGYWLAQNYLAEIFFMESDYENAVYWYLKAAEKGYDISLYKLGLCYHCGHGVEKDEEIALHWYSKAAAQGNKEAQEILNNMKNSNENYDSGEYMKDLNDATEEMRSSFEDLALAFNEIDTYDDISDKISSSVEYHLGGESSCTIYTRHISYDIREKAKKNIVDKSDVMSGVAGATLGFLIGGPIGALIGKGLGDSAKSEQEFTCDVDDIVAIVDASTFDNCKDGMVFTKDGVFFSQTGDVSVYIEYIDIITVNGTTGFLGGKLEIERISDSDFIWTNTIIPKNEVAKLLNELKDI